MQPPRPVVAAFGGDPDRLVPLPGGQGTSWRAGPIVLKPAQPGEPIPWLATACAAMPASPHYRFARWIRATDGSWSVNGWSATRWLPGQRRQGAWKARLATAARFHADLPELDSEALTMLEAREDPWSIGVRVAWGRRAIPGHLPSTLEGILADLAPLLTKPWTGPAMQLVHGDLAGNLLYADGLPPAIIDMSPHVAPAKFAEAMLVADSTAWEGAPSSFAAWYATTQPNGRQLLARAVTFRLVTAMTQWPDQPQRLAAELAGYRPVISALVVR